jgi:hypothetical protein
MPCTTTRIARQSERARLDHTFPKKRFFLKKKVGSFCDPRNVTTNSNALSDPSTVLLMESIGPLINSKSLKSMSGVPHLPLSPSFKIRNDILLLNRPPGPSIYKKPGLTKDQNWNNFGPPIQAHGIIQAGLEAGKRAGLYIKIKFSI